MDYILINRHPSPKNTIRLLFEHKEFCTLKLPDINFLSEHFWLGIILSYVRMYRYSIDINNRQNYFIREREGIQDVFIWVYQSPLHGSSRHPFDSSDFQYFVEEEIRKVTGRDIATVRTIYNYDNTTYSIHMVYVTTYGRNDCNG